MRKLKYHVAITLDEFIAHTNHAVNRFVDEGEHGLKKTLEPDNENKTFLSVRTRAWVVTPQLWSGSRSKCHCITRVAERL